MQAALSDIPPHTTHLSNPCHTESITDSTNADPHSPHPHPHSTIHSTIPQHIPTPPPSYPTISAHINPNIPTPHHSDPTRSYRHSTFTSTHHTHPTQTLLNPPRPISTLSNLTPTHLHLYSRTYHSTTPYPTPFRPDPVLPTLHLHIYPPYSPHPNLHTLTPHHSTLPILISTHLHLYPRPYHSTTPYSTPFRPYPLLPKHNLHVNPPYSSHPNLTTTTPSHSHLPTPTSTHLHLYVHVTALHPTLPTEKSDSSVTKLLYYT